MATATAMYHSGRDPLHKVTYKSDALTIVKSERQRRLHKAFLRWHDPQNWPLLREALKEVGRSDLIGNGKHQLIPACQPDTDGYQSARRKNSTPAGSKRTGKPLLTQHTGLPPRSQDGNPWDKREQAKAAAEARRKANGKPAKGGKPGKRPPAPR
jgi:hypothetical protein